MSNQRFKNIRYLSIRLLIASQSLFFQDRSIISFDVTILPTENVDPITTIFYAIPIAQSTQAHAALNMAGVGIHWDIVAKAAFLDAPLPRVLPQIQRLQSRKNLFWEVLQQPPGMEVTQQMARVALATVTRSVEIGRRERAARFMEWATNLSLFRETIADI